MFWSCVFFRPLIFRCPSADFRATLPHDAVCPEIVYLLQGCSYVPLNKLSNEDIAEIERLRDVAMATKFGTKIAITGFV